MFKLDLEKAEKPEIKLPTSVGASKTQEFQQNIYFCFIDHTKVFDCVDHNKLWKILQEMEILDHLTASWEISMQVKKQHLELDMEQQTSSKSGKEYVKAVYCHPAYLTYMQSEVKVSQSCSALCNPMDYTVHEILQARILEWVAFPFSRESSQPRDRIQVSWIAGRFFTS